MSFSFVLFLLFGTVLTDRHAIADARAPSGDPDDFNGKLTVAMRDMGVGVIKGVLHGACCIAIVVLTVICVCYYFGIH